MKRIISALFLLGALLVVACNKPKEVPDAVLGQIFHDAMLVNAYLNVNNEFKSDSMNIYEPIFAHYGYTTEDVQYTINNFSRRKSIRLSDVAEYMIGLLEQEANSLNTQVIRQDTIENVARRTSRYTLLSDSTIVVKESADSSLLRFEVIAQRPGDYSVMGSYICMLSLSMNRIVSLPSSLSAYMRTLRLSAIRDTDRLIFSSDFRGTDYE